MRPGTEEFEHARTLIAERIRVLRTEKGFSQEHLADLAGCDRTYIGMLERKQGNPSLLVLAAIAHALGEHIERLVGATPEPSGERAPSEPQ